MAARAALGAKGHNVSAEGVVKASSSRRRTSQLPKPAAKPFVPPRSVPAPSFAVFEDEPSHHTSPIAHPQTAVPTVCQSAAQTAVPSSSDTVDDAEVMGAVPSFEGFGTAEQMPETAPSQHGWERAFANKLMVLPVPVTSVRMEFEHTGRTFGRRTVVDVVPAAAPSVAADHLPLPVEEALAVDEMEVMLL
jgi:hypothetical protein